MLTTLRSCSAMIILAPLVASNFLLLFLSPFSPPNTAKETTRKKCQERQRFCVDTYKYGSRRVCKYGDSTITKCKYGRVGIVAYVDRSVTHILLTHHGSTSPPSHHFYRYRRPLATCYNQRAEATAIILTAMHVHTSNCLLDWLITAQIATYDANMQRYASTHDEVEIIEWRRAASSNLATGCYMLLYSKPSNRRR